jgi:putative flippase GtrA
MVSAAGSVLALVGRWRLRWAKRSLPLWDTRQFFRYALVGAVQNGINLSAYSICLVLGLPFIPSAIVAAALALITSLVLNFRWTFDIRHTTPRPQVVRYVLAWLAVLASGLLLLSLFVDLFHLAKIPAQAMVIVVLAPTAYLLQRHWALAGLLTSSPDKLHRSVDDSLP